MPPADTEVSWDAVASALATLGATPSSTWAEIRGSYRAQVRASHPDLVSDLEPATLRTADLNLAWEVLAAATDHGRRPLPAPPDQLEYSSDGTAAGSELDQIVTLHAPTGDLFVQLLEAAYELGDVNYMDPEAGLIQVVLDGSSAPALLMINLDTESDPPSASFTLDAPDQETAPPIRQVVDQLAEALRPG